LSYICFKVSDGDLGLILPELLDLIDFSTSFWYWFISKRRI